MWLGAGSALVIGGAAAAAGQAPEAILATVLAGLGLVMAASPFRFALVMALAAAAWMLAAGPRTDLLPALIGALALGGVTSEMLLGHWYLVDPRLPRSALRRLAAAGFVGMLADAALIAVKGGPGGIAAPWVPVVLGLVTALLMVAVWLSLRVSSYSGVMAATGLSYLAVLTSLGAVAVGRSVI
jgi:hypothetical protein